jgi:hypothetical protein
LTVYITIHKKYTVPYIKLYNKCIPIKEYINNDSLNQFNKYRYQVLELLAVIGFINHSEVSYKNDEPTVLDQSGVNY